MKVENSIGTKELRTNLKRYIEHVRKGNTVTVYKWNKPVFRLEPIETGMWETVIDFTKLKSGGIDIDDLLTRLES